MRKQGYRRSYTKRHALLNFIDRRGCEGGYVPAKACQPTDTPRGSKDRVRVYAERVLRGEELYHDQDAGHDLS